MNGFALIAAPHEVIPLGNEISEWATLMAEGNTAIHAAPSLLLQICNWLLFVNFFPILNPNIDWTTRRSLAWRS